MNIAGSEMKGGGLKNRALLQKVTSTAHARRYPDAVLASMAVMVKETYQLILDQYPAGCLAWLRRHDPGRIDLLKATVEEARRAYLARDPRGLGVALASYQGAHLKTFDEYELQGAMFSSLIH